MFDSPQVKRILNMCINKLELTYVHEVPIDLRFRIVEHAYIRPEVNLNRPAISIRPEMPLRARAPKARHPPIFTSQRAIRRADLACEHAKRRANFSGNSSYEMLREISILYCYIENSTFYLISQLYVSYVYVCVVNKNCIILHVILKKSVWNFFFFIFFLFAL